MVNVRGLDGIDDDVIRAIGALSTFDFGTKAALIKRLSLDTVDVLIGLRTTAASFLSAALLIDFNQFGISEHWNSAFKHPPDASINVWWLIVVRKGTGAVAPRFSIKNLSTGTWIHGASGTTLGDTTNNPGTDGSVRFSNPDGSAPAHIRVAAEAVWNNEVHWAADAAGDTAIEAAGLETALSNWLDEKPSALWGFGQAATTDPVPDYTGNGANQTSITGTTVVNDTDLTFDFDLRVGKNFLRNTLTEPGTGGDVRDLSETQGVNANINKQTDSTTFIEAFRFQRTPSETIVSDTFPCSLEVGDIGTLISGEARWRIQRINSAGAVQASTPYSAVFSTNGIKTATLTFATAQTWAANDRLAFSVELRRTGVTGSVSMELRVNDADSWVDSTFQTVSGITLALGLINAEAIVFAPTLSFGSITLTPSLINSEAVVFAPELTTSTILDVGLINSEATVFEPSLSFGSITIALGFINSEASVLTPGVVTAATIAVGLINAEAVVFEPTLLFGSITIALGLINSQANVLVPTITDEASSGPSQGGMSGIYYFQTYLRRS